MTPSHRRNAASGIIGARSTDNEGCNGPPPEQLAPCPCGEDAVWYRLSPPEAPKTGRALTHLNADESGDNLCDACFPLAVPPDRRHGWSRLDGAVPAARRRAALGEEDQDNRYRGGLNAFAPPPLPPDDE